MHKSFLIAGSVCGALAVGLGAFGAHGLKKIVPPETVAVFQTGVQYQMYHSLALLLVAVIAQSISDKMIQWAGWCFLYGIVLFSGSLYFLVIMKAADVTGFEKAGIVTPVGGALFITGWIFLLLSSLKRKNHNG